MRYFGFGEGFGINRFLNLSLLAWLEEKKMPYLFCASASPE